MLVVQAKCVIRRATGLSDEHWYRNTEWTPEIQTAFEAKLSKTRNQRSQYLRIQGSILIDHQPRAAISLLERCIEIDGDYGGYHLAHAKAELARAYLAAGESELMFRALEAAIEQQFSDPVHGTSAPYDYCSIVALEKREDRYDAALALLDRIAPGPFALTAFQFHVSRALILWERGLRDEARASAELALIAEGERIGPVPGYPGVGIVPRPNPLTERVIEILAACSQQ